MSPPASSCSGEAVQIARHIKERIRALTGLTASVGVAPNKLIAKIASDLSKPDGLTVVSAARVREVLDPLSVRRMPGLGRKTGAKVEAAGIATLGQLRSAPDAVLWPLFGRYSAWMRERAAGIDERPVQPDTEDKSLSAEDTFEHDIADPQALQRELARLADLASTRLRARALVSRLRGGEDPPRRLHHLHAPARPGATDLRGAHGGRGGRRAAQPLAHQSTRGRNFACWAWSSLN